MGAAQRASDLHGLTVSDSVAEFLRRFHALKVGTTLEVIHGHTTGHAIRDALHDLLDDYPKVCAYRYDPNENAGRTLVTRVGGGQIHIALDTRVATAAQPKPSRLEVRILSLCGVRISISASLAGRCAP